MKQLQIGDTIVCPHGDGDYDLKVFDLHNWSTGSCIIRQTGQGESHDIVVTKSEAEQLAEILLRFALSH